MSGKTETHCGDVRVVVRLEVSFKSAVPKAFPFFGLFKTDVMVCRKYQGEN